MANHPEIAFLLGAGATADAELPTATGLTDLVQDGISTRHPKLLPVLRYVSGAIQFGKACRNEPPTQKINIEDLLVACSFLASRNQHYVYPFVSSWHELINDFQSLPEDIQSDSANNSFQFLADYCKAGLREWLAIREPAKLKYLWGFRDFVNRGYKLRIFTLNYDECIERALSDALGPINAKWTTGFDQTGWNPEQLGSSNYDVYVYKLHGSLDWVNDEKLGICSVKWPPAPDSEELPSDFKPYLIFGTDAKMQAVDPFLTLLFRFQQVLNNSSVLVVVGYSFGDAYINDMIFEALQRGTQMRCIVADTHSLEELLPRRFKRFVAIEQRFKQVKRTAQEAFTSNRLLEEVQEVLSISKEEPPFR